MAYLSAAQTAALGLDLGKLAAAILQGYRSFGNSEFAFPFAFAFVRLSFALALAFALAFGPSHVGKKIGLRH